MKLELRAIRADGTNRRTLLDLHKIETDLEFPLEVGDPDWSPDGRRIVFTGEDGIYVLNADGSGLRRLVRNGEMAAWSPDGKLIAFVDDGVSLIRPDGTGRLRVTSGGGHIAPSWSPDGKRLVFGRDFYSIVVIDASDRNPQVLATVPQDQLLAVEPVWSPDGSRVAFIRNRDDAEWELRTLNVRTARQEVIWKCDEVCSDPAWSPDGSRIAFMENFEIAIVGADGSGRKRLPK